MLIYDLCIRAVITIRGITMVRGDQKINFYPIGVTGLNQLVKLVNWLKISVIKKETLPR